MIYLWRSLNGHTQLNLIVHQCSDNILISDNVNGQVYQCFDGNWIVESVDISPISYGNLSFYCNFINFNCSTSKWNSNSLYSVKSHCILLSILLLLCGDVHPRPGPTADIVDRNSRDSDSKAVDFTFYMLTLEVYYPRFRIYVYWHKTPMHHVLEYQKHGSMKPFQILKLRSRTITLFVAILTDMVEESVYSFIVNWCLTPGMISFIKTWKQRFYFRRPNPYLLASSIDLQNSWTFWNYLKLCVLVHLILWNMKLLF